MAEAAEITDARAQVLESLQESFAFKCEMSGMRPVVNGRLVQDEVQFVSAAPDDKTLVSGIPFMTAGYRPCVVGGFSIRTSELEDADKAHEIFDQCWTYTIKQMWAVGCACSK